ncbi:DUF3329 domain-containing protein [Ligilactobacillus animalis]|uniref:DUF3329 domain-containing protein n=1 Tax=Ligilactobacillus animalis TaxID=1605 RepID=UPI00241DA700|nr:DUF6056 family protein [Ligilactobacillus animalis]
MLEKLNKNNYVFWGLQICLCIFMFLWNFVTPLWDDDLEPAKYKNIFEIFKQTMNDYIGWNGRAVGQTLFRLLSVGNNVLVSVLNALVFVFMVRLIYGLTISKKGLKVNNICYVVLVLSLMIMIPTFGQTVLWKAGSGNYLWVVTINLFFIWLFTNENFITPKVKLTIENIGKTVFLMMVGIFAGFGNENTSGGTLLIALMYMIFFYLKYKKLSLSQMLGFLASLLGYIMLICAPAAKIRTIATFGQSYYDTPIIFRALKGLYLINTTMIKYYIPLLVIITILAVVRYNIYGIDQFFVQGLVWIGAGLAVIYVLALSPMGQEGGRTFFGGIIYEMIGIFLLIPTDEMKLDYKWPKMINQLLTIGVFITAFLMLPNGIYDSLKSSRAINERYTLIREVAKNQPNQVITVPKLSYEPQTKYSVNYQLMDVSKDSEAWPNELYKDYFKIKGVRLGE